MIAKLCNVYWHWFCFRFRWKMCVANVKAIHGLIPLHLIHFDYFLSSWFSIRIILFLFGTCFICTRRKYFNHCLGLLSFFQRKRQVFTEQIFFIIFLIAFKFRLYFESFILISPSTPLSSSSTRPCVCSSLLAIWLNLRHFIMFFFQGYFYLFFHSNLLGIFSTFVTF